MFRLPPGVQVHSLSLREECWLLWRRLSGRPVDQPLCPRCRYPVTGLGRPECPECGADLKAVGFLDPFADLRRVWRWVVAVWLAAALAAGWFFFLPAWFGWVWPRERECVGSLDSSEELHRITFEAHRIHPFWSGDQVAYRRVRLQLIAPSSDIDDDDVWVRLPSMEARWAHAPDESAKVLDRRALHQWFAARGVHKHAQLDRELDEIVTLLRAAGTGQLPRPNHYGYDYTPTGGPVPHLGNVPTVFYVHMHVWGSIWAPEWGLAAGAATWLALAVVLPWLVWNRRVRRSRHGLHRPLQAHPSAGGRV